MKVKRTVALRREDNVTEELNFFQKWSFSRPEGHILGFRTEKQRRAAWEVHRGALIAEHEGKGYRPAAFWQYDRPDVDLDAYESELGALVDLGLATPKEIAVYHGKDMFDDDREQAQFYIDHPDQQGNFNKDVWQPLIEKYQRIFGDKVSP